MNEWLPYPAQFPAHDGLYLVLFQYRPDENPRLKTAVYSIENDTWGVDLLDSVRVQDRARVRYFLKTPLPPMPE